MTLQRRHFELIAEILARLDHRSYTADEIAARFASALASTNPNFNRARFLRACGVED